MRKKETYLILVILAILVAIAIGVFFITRYTGFASVDYETSLARYASDATQRGSNITRVYVRISVNSADSSLGISERIPEGFRVVSFSSGGVLIEDRIEWLFVPGRNTGVFYYLEPVQNIKNLSFSGEWYGDKGEGQISGSFGYGISGYGGSGYGYGYGYGYGTVGYGSSGYSSGYGYGISG